MIEETTDEELSPQSIGTTHKLPLRSIVEALLFGSKEPLTIQKMKEVIQQFFQATANDIKQEIALLQEEYDSQNRSFTIETIAGGYILRSRSEYYPYLQLLLKSKKQDRLSPATLETLAIIAYKQPITKIQIEMIRGVDCSGTLHVLQERMLVEISGKLEAPGRPSLYSTTAEFLKHFGLKDLSCLPTPPVAI